ncbi:MAG: AtpZ/AtpI family protein [Bacteroidetes bacterium]|nr:AtpZ/AtpI family protein [Bacteroidota bacterium]
MGDKQENNKTLMKYAGMGVQFLVSIALAVYIGIKADGWMQLSFPLFVWLLPLIMIFGITYKIIKETSKK